MVGLGIRVLWLYFVFLMKRYLSKGEHFVDECGQDSELTGRREVIDVRHGQHLN